MKLTKDKVFLFIVVLFMSLLIIVSEVCPAYVRADSVAYSNVLDDLKKDSSFNESYYPLDSKDYSLKLIQLAESVDNELFVYVYQPSGQAKNLKASSINLSTTIDDLISFNNYKLEYLNSSGVFYKYKVKDITVKNDAVRYYSITSIFRPFDETIDKQASGDNKITEVEFDISEQFEFGEINGNSYVHRVKLTTIEITDKFVGFVRYPSGFKLYQEACDAHFVAFNTDMSIDKLLEADVYYTTQKYDYSYSDFRENETFGEKIDNNVAKLKNDQKVDYNGGGLFAATFSWERIQTVENFIANENKNNVYSGALFDVTYGTKLTDLAKAELQGKKWVLRFAETGYVQTSSNVTDSLGNIVSSGSEHTTLVGDVTILRLKFVSDGKTYNLGVIDNKQTGSSTSSNTTQISVKLNENGKGLLYLIMLILLIVLLYPILPYIFKAIVWIVSLPFKIIKWLIDKLRGG